MTLTHAQAVRPVLAGWSFATVPVFDVPSRLDGLTRRAGGVQLYGPGLTAGQPVRVVDLAEAACIILAALDDAHRAATGGVPLRVRMGTAVPAEDGLVVADWSYCQSLAEAARIRAQGGA